MTDRQNLPLSFAGCSFIGDQERHGSEQWFRREEKRPVNVRRSPDALRRHLQAPPYHRAPCRKTSPGILEKGRHLNYMNQAVKCRFRGSYREMMKKGDDDRLGDALGLRLKRPLPIPSGKRLLNLPESGLAEMADGCHETAKTSG
jgi:hypothetical protein